MTSRFGVAIDEVTLEKNVICGGPTKVLYRADWSALAAPSSAPEPGVVDEIDVGDVISEEEHGYVSPAPNGGWTTLEILEVARGARRFDAGRIIPAGGAESFVLRRAPNGRARVALRTDARPGVARIRSPREERPIVFEPAREGAWTRGVASFDHLEVGDRIEIVADGVELRDYHMWIEKD